MWSRSQMIENMNFYSDPRTIQGMSTTHKGFEADGSVCWNFVMERLEYLFDDGDYTHPTLEALEGREQDKMWNDHFEVFILDYLREKFEELSEIPCFETLMEFSKDPDKSLHFPRVVSRTAWAICSQCDGNGSHVSPSIDCGGITQDEFDEDPDFAEAYFAGRFDVSCKPCGGSGKVRVPEHTTGFTRWVQEQVDQADQDSYECAMERAAELRMGC